MSREYIDKGYALASFRREVWCECPTCQSIAIIRSIPRHAACAFSIFVFTDFIGLFRPALFLHPRMIHPLDP